MKTARRTVPFGVGNVPTRMRILVENKRVDGDTVHLDIMLRRKEREVLSRYILWFPSELRRLDLLLRCKT